MTLFPAVEAGLSIQMSQTIQQEEGAVPGKPKAGRHWELFWRIIAGLMLIVIAWVVWVLYQITPRSVVTPLAFESKARPIGAQPAPTGVSPPVSSSNPVPSGAPAEPVAPRAAVPTAADLAMEQAQAAARAGAHQSSADVQAAALEKMREALSTDEQEKREGLKLSTEMSTPVAEKKAVAGKREGKAAAD